MSRAAGSAVPGARRGSTATVLRRLRRLLVVLTALTLAASMWVFTAARELGTVIRTGAAPTVAELGTARSALLEAERIAFAEDPAGGAYPAFLRQVQVAGQGLARAAGSDPTPGDEGRRLQSVQGQLVELQGIVAGLAYGRPAEAGGPALRHADLADAYGLVHGDGGMLPNLDQLILAQQETVDDLAGSARLGPWAVGGWLLCLLALLGTLIATQVFLSRRLRRTVNPPLLLATALLVVAVGYGGALVTDYRAGADPDFLVARVAGTTQAERDARKELRDRIDCRSSCGTTLDLAVRPNPVDAAQQAREVSSKDPRTLSELAEAPVDDPGPLLLPIAALAVAGLGWIGLQRPVDEYRFER